MDGLLVGRDVGGEGDEDAGEGFGDEEAVPGVEGPGAEWEGVEGSDPGGSGERGELGRAGFGDLGGAAGAVGGDGAAMAGGVGFRHAAESRGSSAAGRTADGAEAEQLDSAGDELAVKAAGDEDGDVAVAEAVGAGQQGAVPEGEDGRTGDGVADGGVGAGEVLVAEGLRPRAE